MQTIARAAIWRPPSGTQKTLAAEGLALLRTAFASPMRLADMHGMARRRHRDAIDHVYPVVAW